MYVIAFNEIAFVLVFFKFLLSVCFFINSKKKKHFKLSVGIQIILQLNYWDLQLCLLVLHNETRDFLFLENNSSNLMNSQQHKKAYK